VVFPGDLDVVSMTNALFGWVKVRARLVSPCLPFLTLTPTPAQNECKSKRFHHWRGQFDWLN
jgi:hypothetical protein